MSWFNAQHTHPPAHPRTHAPRAHAHRHSHSCMNTHTHACTQACTHTPISHYYWQHRSNTTSNCCVPRHATYVCTPHIVSCQVLSCGPRVKKKIQRMWWCSHAGVAGGGPAGALGLASTAATSGRRSPARRGPARRGRSGPPCTTSWGRPTPARAGLVVTMARCASRVVMGELSAGQGLGFR